MKPPRWFAGSGSSFWFNGTQDSFDRDFGLTVRGFQSIGVESKAFALGPPKEGDLPDMLRVSRGDLENREWWERQELDGLVFYTWGKARYLTMVLAAMSAGIKVVQVSDHAGVYPLSDLSAHLRAEAAHHWYEPRWKRMARTLAKIPYNCTLRLLTHDIPDARAIGASHFLLAATPQAAERYQTLVSRVGGKDAARRVRFVPIPVNFHFSFPPERGKEDEVVAVGRWDSPQKRVSLLMGSIEHIMRKGPGKMRFRVFGRRTRELEAWWGTLARDEQGRVELEGMVPNADLADAYRRAKVMLVSAAYEGCHVSSGEAVCSGASIVGCRSPFLSALEWHVSKQSGRLTEQASPIGLGDTAIQELAAWDRGERDPVRISREWTSEMHPDRVARAIMGLFGEESPGRTS